VSPDAGVLARFCVVVGFAFGTLLAGTGLGGCAATRSSGTSQLNAGVSSFDAARAEATRRIEIYDVVDRVADLRATLLTPRVRKAYANERSRFHGAFASRAQKDWLAMGDADEGVDAPPQAGPFGDGEVLIFVAFYAADAKTRSLSSRSSIWDVALVRDGVRARPSRIEEVTSSPAVGAVFPYVDRFDDLYLLHFPMVDPATGTALLGPGDVALEVSSVRGACIVHWLLLDDAA
jgi:hypothetical protein